MSIYQLSKPKNQVKKFLPKIKKASLKTHKLKPPKIKGFHFNSKNPIAPLLSLSIFLSVFLGFLAGGFFVNYFFSLDESLRNFSFFQSITGQQNESNLSNSNSSQFISQEQAIIDIVKNASPAVVSIIVTKDLPVIEQYLYNPFQEFEDFFQDDFEVEVPRYREKGTEKKEIGGGTGFIVSKDGLILTNKHVVLDENADYTILTNNGEKFEAQVLARDPVQDIAILKIQADKLLPTLKLADSDKIEIGQTVIAIGNVLGEFRNSVSVGIVSGLKRDITAVGGSFSEFLEGIIQTDAAINLGNSGGPLLNLKGQVIGMNTATAINAQSVGFAIPINNAKKDIAQVKEYGEIVYPFLGVYYTIITPALKQDFDLSVDYGAWVGRDRFGAKTETAVFADSAAEKAGLKQDDIILEFNHEKITLENSLANIIMKYNPDNVVELKVLRGSDEVTLTATLTKKQP